MKRLLAWGLALLMATAQAIPVFAADENAVGKGGLELTLRLAAPMERAGAEKKIKAVLSPQSGNPIELEIGDGGVKSFGVDGAAATGKSVERQVFNFQEVPVGQHTLAVSGAGMRTYTQTVSVRENTVSKLTIETISQLQMGDIDGNGKLDVDDKERIIAEMKVGATTPQTDLNEDGQTDILDLSYFYTGSRQQPKPAKVNDLTVQAQTGTVVQSGNVLDLVQKGKETSVELKPTSGQIGADNPVAIELDMEKTPLKASGVMIALPQNGNMPANGEIIIELDDGSTVTKPFTDSTIRTRSRRSISLFSNRSDPAVITNNTILIDLGKQVAVKRVIIKVTGTKDNTNLAEISKVEFIGDMADRVPPPKMDIPTGVKGEGANKSFTLSWAAQTNVSGYEVEVSTEKTFATDSKIQRIACGGNSAKVSSYLNGKLKNGTTYYVRVQSVNGTWESGFSEIIEVTPKATSAPDAPGGGNIKPGYRELSVSWGVSEDADGYNLYYKKQGEAEYKSVLKITGTNYKLTNLEDKTKYLIYLTAYNDIGTSGRSSELAGETIDLEPPVTTNYKLLNTSNGKGKPTAHIKNVQVSGYNASAYPNGFDPFFAVDSDYTTHWTDSIGNTYNGPIITFDQPYDISKVIFSTRLESEFIDNVWSIPYKSIIVWETEDSQPVTIPGGQINWKPLQAGTIEAEFPRQTAQKIQVKFHRAYGWVTSMSELKYYLYDSLEDDVDNLFSDALHIKLREGVTLETIEALETRANTVDAASGEYHPKKAALLREIQRAKELLGDTAASDVIMVDQSVSNSRNGHLGFSFPMNDWQPLGVTAMAGEEINVYVGKTGNKLPKLVVSQHYPEYTHLMKEIDLKEGKNTITIPTLGGIDTERGGSLYVRYPHAEASGEIQVRVSGGSRIPVLDIHGMTEEAAIREKLRVYVQQLKAHVAALEQTHITAHQQEDGYPYNERHCILNNTEIVLDDMMLTIPATQALASIGGANASDEQLGNQLYNGTIAVNEMMDLFYKEKGLVARGTDGEERNWRPASRMNLRYSRMLAGAFMYAAGWHMGIEYDSTQLLGGSPMQIVDGKPVGYNDTFGWGIAHEVGHVMDQQGMAIAEITNNIFPLFLQTRDDKSKSRLETGNGYVGIYEKVTSGSRGRTSDGFTSLGMYWQLHLAFDNSPTWDNTVTDTFYAKLHRLYRAGGGGSGDDRLIRLSSDAAGYDMRGFFEKWGILSNDETNRYLDEKAYKDPGAIYYLNDEARRYRINKGTAMNSGTTVTADITNATNSKEVRFEMSVSGDSDKILGYEIIRNGAPVGFVQANSNGITTYTDIISSANNTVFTYQVVAYDYLLNKTQPTEEKALKISHDGSISKAGWTVDTNAHTGASGDENDPCGLHGPAIKKVMDDNADTSFEGTAKSGDAYITINLNDTYPTIGLRYRGDGISNYEIAVSKDNKNWTPVRRGSFSGDQTVYFAQQDGDLSADPAHSWSYEAGYVKLTAKGSSRISAAEIDVIAPPGDNIEFLQDGFVGTLGTEFVYGQDEKDKIPAGAVVVTGTYRGNPAYNTVLLKDAQGNTLNGEQVLFADVPNGSDILDVQSGTWVFWVTDGQAALSSRIKAQLYRTDDAFTNGGQRMVSDTLYVAVPETLSNITLSGGINPTPTPPPAPEAPLKTEETEKKPNGTDETQKPGEENVQKPSVSEIPPKDEGAVAPNPDGGATPPAQPEGEGAQTPNNGGNASKPDGEAQPDAGNTNDTGNTQGGETENLAVTVPPASPPSPPEGDAQNGA